MRRWISESVSADSQRALAYLDALAETGARTVLTGHGGPWTKGIEKAVGEAHRAGVS